MSSKPANKGRLRCRAVDPSVPQRLRRAARAGVMAAAVCAVGAPARHALADGVWSGGTGNWSDPTQWTGAVPDDPAEKAIIHFGHAILDQSYTISGLSMDGGRISGSNDLTLVNLMSWTGGTLSDPGRIIANGGISIGFANEKFLEGRRLENSQLAMWDGGGITFSNGAVLDNSGTFDIRVAANVSASGTGSAGVFNNSGLLLKSNGSTLISPVFNNSGTVRVTSGQLALGGGGTASGRFEAQGASSTLRFLGGYLLDEASSVSGSGTMAFDGGVVTIRGDYNISGTTAVSGGDLLLAGTNAVNLGKLVVGSGSILIDAPAATASQLDQIGGTIDGSGVLTVNGPAVWQGGTQKGSGTTLVAAPGLELKGGAKLLDGSRTFQLGSGMSGTWSEGDLTLAGSSTFQNDGTLTITHAANLLDAGGTGRLVNNGLVEKTVAAGMAVFNAEFINNGTARSTSGQLRFNGGGSSTGHFDAAGGSLEFMGKAYTLGGGSRITGSNFTRILGEVSVALDATVPASNVILQGSGRISGGGNLVIENLSWVGGVVTGGVEVTDSISMAGGQKTVGGRRLRIDEGAIAGWSGGNVFFSGGGILENRSTLRNTFNGTMSTVEEAGGAVHNFGVFEKAGGAGVTAFHVPFDNSGTVRVSTGTIFLNGNGVSTGHFDLTGGPLELGGGYVLDQGTAFSGTNKVKIVGNVVVSGSVTASLVEQTGGTMGGGGSLTVDNFQWKGGTQGGNGSTWVNVALTMSDPEYFLYGRRVTVAPGATATWSAGTIFGADGGRLINSGTFVTTFDGEIIHHQGERPAFDNPGEFRKDAGTGTTTIGSFFNNAGVTRVNSGVLRLNGGGAGAGQFELAEHTRLEIAGGYSMAGGAGISGSGVARLVGGTLEVLGNATAAQLEQVGGSMDGGGELAVEKFSWTGGTLGGSGTTSVSRLLTMGGGADLELAGRTLTIAPEADATWAGGNVRISLGGSIDNRGDMVIGGDAQLTRIDGEDAVFRNAGTLTKSGGTNASAFVGVTFDNPGMLEVSAGTLSVAAAQYDVATRTLSGGTWRVKSGGTLDLGLLGINNSLAEITLDGSTASFPNLATLADNRGMLELKNGKHLAVGPNLVNSGTVRVDAPSSLNVPDVLTNQGVFESAGPLNTKSVINTGSFVQSGALTASTLFQNGGTGTADLAGTMLWGDGARLRAEGGGVIVRRDAGTAEQMKLNVEASGGLIDLRSSQHLASLHIGAGKVKVEAGGEKVVRAKAYSAEQEGQGGAWKGQLDLADAKAIFEYGEQSPVNVVRDQIRSGYNGGGENAWTGNGIASSVAAADPQKSLALGFGEAADLLGPTGGTFAGETVGDKAVLIALTKFGDANLDGKVSFGDFQRLERSFGREALWAGGDFDYSGTVDHADFKLLFDHFGQSMGGGPPAPASFVELSSLLAFAEAHAVAVPEPGAGALLGLVTGVLFGRRRRSC